jgi:FKBP-type peptidyl-prolyl cis-trans isomerase
MIRVIVYRIGKEAEAFDCSQSAWDAGALAIDRRNADTLARRSNAQLEAIRLIHPGLIEGSDGIWYEILVAGTGPKVGVGRKVSLHYSTSLADGRMVDSSARQGVKPIEFINDAGLLIDGFWMSVADMAVGERRIAAIPPELGYGADGAMVIPPNSWLLFDLELVSAD